MDGFLNEFVGKLQALPALIVFVLLSLPTFGYFYNKLMDRILSRTEHTSLYVVGGVAVTLAAGALFSWKSGLLYFLLFALSGLPMIVGEFRRTEQHNKTVRENKLRRKRLPYAVNGYIEDAYDAANAAQKLLDVAMKHNGKNVESAIPLAHASQEMSMVISNLVQVKLIQGDQ
jgi:hypothetical protein